jgi:hypothetical protein
MESYRRAAVERAMKVQEVIMRAMAKKITWKQAGEIIGLRSWLRCLLLSGLAGQAGNNCNTRQQVNGKAVAALQIFRRVVTDPDFSF